MNERLEKIIKNSKHILGITDIVNDLKKEENKDLLIQENKFEIISAMKYQKMSVYGFQKFYEFIFENFNDEETYKYLMETILDSNIKFNYKDREIAKLLDIIPDEYITKEMLFEFISKMDITDSIARKDLLKNIPENLQTSDIYSAILEKAKDCINKADIKDSFKYGKALESYTSTFDSIPAKSKTIEMLVNGIGILNNQTVLNNIELLKNDFQNKKLYSVLLNEIASKTKNASLIYAKLLDIIPEEEQTEENLLLLFSGQQKNIYGANNILDILDRKNRNLSFDFYKKVIQTLSGVEHANLLYKKIPKEYQNEELFLEFIESNVNNPCNLYEILKEYVPKDIPTNIIYEKIIKIINENSEDNELKSKNYEFIIESISYNIKDWNERREYRDTLIAPFIVNVKQYRDTNNNIIYTPDAMSKCYKAFKEYSGRVFHNDYLKYVEQLKEKTKIYEYFSEIINSEKNNIENKTFNLEQIRVYEKELYGERPEKRSSTNNPNNSETEKNPFWSICAILNIVPEDIRDGYRENVYEIIKENLEKYNTGQNSDVIDFFKEIMDNNEELFLTLNNDFFKSDKYLNLFGREKFEVLIAYPEIQNSILNLDEIKLKLFSNYINYAEKGLSEHDAKITDWVPTADIILKGFENNNQFKEINSMIANSNFEDLSRDIRNKYIHVISKRKNWFNINTIEDLENYEEIRKKICIAILENDDKNIPSQFKSMKKAERMIFARLQLEFGLDISEAENLIKKYGEGLNEEQKREGIGITLNLINKILNTKADDLESLKNFNYNIISQSDFILMQNLDAKCRESYMGQYQKCLYKVDEHENDVAQYNAEYNGKKIKVMEPAEDFNMMVHSLGAYSKKGTRKDYKKDWNIPNVVNHGLCISYVGNNNLGTAKIDSVMYGFSNFTSEQLQLSSPWDICSKYANVLFSISSVEYNHQNGIKFLNPKEQINNTRHTHNEIVVERRQFSKGSKFQKMQPSYIIYMPEYFEGKNQEEIDKLLENREEEIKKFMKTDPKWKEAQKAADQFEIPIVILDRAHIAQKESEKIEEMLKQIEEGNVALISDFICEFENNRAGNRDYHKEICDKYFSEDILDRDIERIEASIEKLPTRNERKQAYELLKSAYVAEIQKREQFRKTEDDPIATKWGNRLYEASTRIKKTTKEEESEIEGIIDILKKEQKVSIPSIERDVIDQIADMKNRKLYDGKFAHSDRHIQNVMLFASILGRKRKLPERDMQLLMEAAKFHDSGRMDDTSKKTHAPPSALIAGEKLKNQYSSDELNIIKVAILYHEPHEAQKGKLDESLFSSLASKEECLIRAEDMERARRICEILKDADSLDRTRFVNKAQLNPEFLHLQESHELIDFSRQINEKYAENDIELYCSNNEEEREAVEMLLHENNGNVLKTIKAIRHGALQKKETKKTGIALDELATNSKKVGEEDVIAVTKAILDMKRKKVPQYEIQNKEI